MANERRVISNLVGGLVEDNPLAANATTLTSSGLTALPVIDSTAHAIIVFDPDGTTGGPPFAKRVVAHVLGAGSATIEATEYVAPGLGTARAIPRDTPWVHTPLAEDYRAVPTITRVISSPGNVTAAIGSAGTTIADTTVTPVGSVGRMADVFVFTTVYGTTGSTSAAGHVEIYDVEGATTIATSRWHTNGVERQIGVGLYAKMWVPAGTSRTVRVRLTNDAGSGQSVESRDARLNITYTEL